MPKQKIAKKLPKRTTNDRLKARRAASWARGQERKELRRKAQRLAETRNRAAGTTPWEQARKPAPTPTGENFVGRSTDYGIIRGRMDRYLGHPGITVDYLEGIHRRWRSIGRKAVAGRL